MRRQTRGTELPRRSHWGQLGRTVVTMFVGAVCANYLWELAQSPLYVGLEDIRTTLRHCFVASLGDGLMVLGIVAGGGVIFRQPAWFLCPGVQGTIVMLMVGLVLGVTVEWVAVHVLQRWAYTARMPRVPGLDVGLVPVAQMLVLPPLIFRLVARWYRRIAGRT
jgi:hypothetical protein